MPEFGVPYPEFGVPYPVETQRPSRRGGSRAAIPALSCRWRSCWWQCGSAAAQAAGHGESGQWGQRGQRGQRDTGEGDSGVSGVRGTRGQRAADPPTAEPPAE